MDSAVKSTKKSDWLDERPVISLVDVDDKLKEILVRASYNVVSATLGSPIQVDNLKSDDAKWVNFNYFIPVDLHEHDVVVIDLAGGKITVPHKKFSRGNAAGGKFTALYSSYPERVFNPRPGGMLALGKEIDSLLKKKAIIVIFADSMESAEYRTVNVVGKDSKFGSRISADTSDLYTGFPVSVDRVGVRIKSPSDDNPYFDLVKKHIEGNQYKLVFEHPTRYVQSKYRNIKVPEFIPLVLNDRDEVVSYSHCVDEGFVYVFPQVENKGAFLLDFFSILSVEHPDIFPCSSQFEWVDSGIYPVPGELELLEKREQIERQYLLDIEKNSLAIQSAKEEYQFLRDLLLQTGEPLVEAVALYFKWLGFDSVVNYDNEAEDVLEEDLQVQYGDKLLVVEIKGIGGTSTDQACSQITKIKNRRMKQKKSFEVYGLYVVNHERYKSPILRKNPPFTDHQLSDSVSDERGLITTYQLYQAYMLIRDGILNKEDVKEQLLAFGLVDLVPKNLKSLGTPREYFMHGKVIVVDLLGGVLSVGDEIVVCKNSVYKKHIVESLKIDDVEVDCASDSVVGIRVGAKIFNKSEIFIYSS